MFRIWASWIAIIVSLAASALCVAALVYEKHLAEAARGPEAAFKRGSIGLEAIPLAYALTLDELSAGAFDRGDGPPQAIWDEYGFLGGRPGACPADDSRAAAEAALPVGLSVSRLMPGLGYSTPVRFVGVACAACHTGAVRGGAVTDPVVGMGADGLDIIGWSAALTGAIADPRLSATGIVRAYEARCGEIGLFRRVAERAVIWAWLRGARAAIRDGMGRHGVPLSGPALLDPDKIAAGPGRTRPFQSIVRQALDLPAQENRAISKLPAVFAQGKKHRDAAQFDGSVHTPWVRAMIAAFASGASPQSLARDEVSGNIHKAADYTKDLGADGESLRFERFFPGQPAPGDPARGRAVYDRYCHDCHGGRNSAWVYDYDFARRGEVIPVSELGVDDERVRFDHAQDLPLAIWTSLPGDHDRIEAQTGALTDAAWAAAHAGDAPAAQMWFRQRARVEEAGRRFRLGHPLSFARLHTDGAQELTAEPGFLAAPLPHMWLRAPYLHNGSVPTLAALINLDERPAVWCRGKLPYDPAKLGLRWVAPGPEGCPPEAPFRYDSGLRGNGAQGHDFPWARDDPDCDERALRDLLAYLREL